jgi:hypothetical protein
MDKFVLELIKRLASIFSGMRVSDPYIDVRRISKIHPVYANIHTPRMARLRHQVNPDYDACEKFKAKCQPVAFFPGMLENNFPLCKYPIYLVVPWGAYDVQNALTCMRGVVLFNRVVGPDPVEGPSFDNEMGQWGAVLLGDETVLRNLPYDKSMEKAMPDPHDISWLMHLLKGDKILFKLKQ